MNHVIDMYLLKKHFKPPVEVQHIREKLKKKEGFQVGKSFPDSLKSLPVWLHRCEKFGESLIQMENSLDNGQYLKPSEMKIKSGQYSRNQTRRIH